MNEQPATKRLLTTGQQVNNGERIGFVKVLWGILTRPRRTWPYLSKHDRQGWWILLLLLLALILVPSTISWTYEKKAQMAETTPAMSYEKFGYVEQPIAQPSGANVAGLILHIFGRGIGTVVNWLLWGTALYLVSVFWGRSSKFGRMFRLTLWAWIPYAIRGIIQTFFLLLSKRPIWNAGLSGFVLDRSTSGMALLPPGAGQVALASVLGHIDLFLVWNLFLLIGGFIAFTNLRNKRAVWAVMLIWTMLVALGIIPAIVGNSLSQIGK